MVTFKTKRDVWLHSHTWITPILWMRGIRTHRYFVGLIKAEDGYSPLAAAEVEHYETCQCCQNFARMEKRYDHLRGYPQDDEEFTHITNGKKEATDGK